MIILWDPSLVSSDFTLILKGQWISISATVNKGDGESQIQEINRDFSLFQPKQKYLWAEVWQRNKPLTWVTETCTVLKLSPSIPELWRKKRGRFWVESVKEGQIIGEERNHEEQQIGNRWQVKSLGCVLLTVFSAL